jgi:predicted metal-dependent peptidase
MTDLKEVLASTKNPTRKEVEAKVGRAVARLIRTEVFYASLVMRLDRKFTEQVPTVATDGKKIIFNPRFTMAMTDADLRFILIHEVHHVIGKHQFRGKDLDQGKFNVACDHAINNDLLDAGYPRCSDIVGGMWERAYQGMPAEQIYKIMPEDPEPEDGEGGEGGGEGGEAQEGQGGAPGEPGDQQDPNQGPGQDANGKDWDDVPARFGQDDPGGTGSVIQQTHDDGTEMSEGQKAVEEQRQDEKTLQAALDAKAMGSTPGAAEEIIKGIKSPSVDWREELADMVASVVVTDSSYAKPNRRHLHAGMVLPGNVKSGCGEVVVAVDTSASLSTPELEAFNAEMVDIIEEIQPEKTTVIYCDTQVNRVEEFFPGDDFEMVAEGRGGTRFTPPFEHVEKEGLDPELFIYFTDLGANDYPETPPYDVIWAATGAGYQGGPPWGRTIAIKGVF